jgi:thiosulfate dehydrogenase
MNRLIAAANFVHSNMPQGADYLNPVLPTADAWDVAAFVVSQPRPHKAELEKDFPDLAQKPVDAPHGPYLDGFSVEQHKYGPYAPIRAALRRLRDEVKSAR